MWGIVGHTDGVLTVVRWPEPVRLLILTVGPEDLISSSTLGTIISNTC
jgi:hypothetical protein